MQDYPNRRPSGTRMGDISGRGTVPSYTTAAGERVKARPKFSAVTVIAMATGEILRTEPALTLERKARHKRA